MKLQILIFSFNRAMQLDTLLTSLKKHWKIPDFHIDILYNTTSDEYEQGYSILKQRFPEVAFCKENRINEHVSLKDFLVSRNFLHLMKHRNLLKLKTDFRKQCISLMEKDNAKHIMFMTDDAMFIRDVKIGNDIFQWITASPRQRQYSLRLGRGMNAQPEEVKDCGEYLAWDTYKVPQTNNWGYHFSVDAHIYDKGYILELYKKYVFANPNTLEGYICARIRKRHELQEGRSPLETCLLSFPINMVQTVEKNETLGVSTEKMNEYYLNGYTMQYPIPEVIDIFQQYPDCIEMRKENECLRFSTAK